MKPNFKSNQMRIYGDLNSILTIERRNPQDKRKIQKSYISIQELINMGAISVFLFENKIFKENPND